MTGTAAMAKLDWCRRSTGVVALLAALFVALTGVVGAGASSVVTNLADANVPIMLTLDGQKLYNSSSQAHNIIHSRERRRLATAQVWCVAKSNLSDAALQGALDWVCGPMPAQGQVNCGPLQSGQNCFLPDSASNHASWAFNVYFQSHNASNDACDFQGTAVQVYTDPSTSTCIFTGSTKEINGTIISNGTVTPSPPGTPPGIFTNAAPTAGYEVPQFLFHLWAAAVMTSLLT